MPDKNEFGNNCAENVVVSIASNSINNAIFWLDCLIAKNNTDLPANFLITLSLALQTNDWSQIAAAFRNQSFVSPSGEFLMIGPYSVRRLGETFTYLSAFYGRVDYRAASLSELERYSKVIQEIFGMNALRQAIPRILPVHAYATAGAFNDSGEAFIVPDGWQLEGSESGPVLNNIDIQRQRFIDGGRYRIERIFNKATAELLISPFVDRETCMRFQSKEYQIHDAGHSSGIGLKEKLSSNLLSNPFMRGVEEWRADGVAFEIASRLFDTETAAYLVASNLCLRFGMDAHRSGRLLDTDVNCCLLTFSTLLRSGMLEIEDGKLSITDPTLQGLCRIVNIHKAEAIALTQHEIALTSSQEIWQLYGCMDCSAATKKLFEQFILRPCAGTTESLQ